MIPLTNKADQKLKVKEGILKKIKRGATINKENTFRDQATIYSSNLSNFFLLKTSFPDSRSAVNNEGNNQNIFYQAV